MGGCVWLFLQAQEGNTYFTELAERVEYGNYEVNKQEMQSMSELKEDRLRNISWREMHVTAAAVSERPADRQDAYVHITITITITMTITIITFITIITTIIIAAIVIIIITSIRMHYYYLHIIMNSNNNIDINITIIIINIDSFIMFVINMLTFTGSQQEQGVRRRDRCTKPRRQEASRKPDAKTPKQGHLPETRRQDDKEISQKPRRL